MRCKYENLAHYLCNDLDPDVPLAVVKRELKRA